MLFVRYYKNNKIIEQKVTMENAHSVYRFIKRKYINADLIMIDKGVELCLM